MCNYICADVQKRYCAMHYNRAILRIYLFCAAKCTAIDWVHRVWGCSPCQCTLCAIVLKIFVQMCKLSIVCECASDICATAVHHVWRCSPCQCTLRPLIFVQMCKLYLFRCIKDICAMHCNRDCSGKAVHRVWGCSPCQCTLRPLPCPEPLLFPTFSHSKIFTCFLSHWNHYDQLLLPKQQISM